MTKYKIKYEMICNEYMKEFCKKQDCEYDYWVGDAVGGYADIADYFISFDDIRYDIDNDIKAGLIFKYYGLAMDAALEKVRLPNYKNWLKLNYDNYKDFSANRSRLTDNAKRELKLLLSDLAVYSQKASLCRMREALYHYLYNKHGLSLKSIAPLFNRKDHTTIINGLQNKENYPSSYYDEYKETIELYQKQIDKIINNDLLVKSMSRTV